MQPDKIQRLQNKLYKEAVDMQPDKIPRELMCSFWLLRQFKMHWNIWNAFLSYEELLNQWAKLLGISYNLYILKPKY